MFPLRSLYFYRPSGRPENLYGSVLILRVILIVVHIDVNRRYLMTSLLIINNSPSDLISFAIKVLKYLEIPAVYEHE